MKLIDRVTAKIQGTPDIAAVLFSPSYPEPQGECWLWKPRTQAIRVGRTISTPVRTLINIAIAPETLDPCYQPRRTCHERTCVNPTHHELALHNQNRTGGLNPPPPAAYLRTKTVDDAEIEDLASTIQGIEPRPTPAEFKAKCAAAGIDLTDDVIAAAFARIT